MRKKVSLGVALALVFVVAALAVSMTMLISMRYFSGLVEDVDNRKSMYNYLNEIDEAARQNYDIDEAELKRALANGYIRGLSDPYASFLSPEQYLQQHNATAGTALDFGLVVEADRDNRLVVVQVHDGSSAAQSGIMVGDVLQAVNGNAVSGEQLQAVRQTFARDAKVLLSLRRGENNLAVELTASSYIVTSVRGKVIDGIGYLRIFTFHDQTDRQFKTVLADLLSQGVEGVVFDLRGCTGTNSDSVQNILAYLLPTGVYARYNTKNGTTDLLADASYELKVPSVTLTDSYTEGEAEFMAAVLQNFRKTYVVGSNTRGKRSVQQSFVIASDNTAVNLSVGEYSLLKAAAWVTMDAPCVLPLESALYREFLTLEEDLVLSAGLRYLKTGTVETTTTTTTTTTTMPDGETTTMADTATTTAAA